MKIRNFVFATVGAASLALALSACNEPAGNNSANNKPMNTSTPANTMTPANLTPANSSNMSNMSNSGNHSNSSNMSNMSNTKPMNGGTMNSNAKPAPTR